MKSIITIIILTSFTLTSEAQNKLSAKAWQEDLTSLYDSLKTFHKNVFHYTPKEKFDQSYQALLIKLPTLNYWQSFIEFKRFIALCGDGHSFIIEPSNYKKYPLEFFVFNKDVKLIKADSKYKDILGLTLKSINGKSIKYIRNLLSSISSQDESSTNLIKDQMYHLTTAEHLFALGITPTVDSAIFEFQDNRITKKVTIFSENKSNYNDWIYAYEKLPIFLKHHQSCLFTICHEPLNSKVYYINFQGYPQPSKLEEISDNIYAGITQQVSYDKIIIDMRSNGGGNFYHGLKYFVSMLMNYKSWHPETKFYVLIGRQTFSAGMSNTVHLRDCLNATLVGEPTGAKPNGYQENKWFILPNSKLMVSCSQLYYKFQNKNTNGVQPDVRIKPSFINYSKGIDPAIDWIVNN